MSADTTYKVAVSRHALAHKIPPGDNFWPTFNGSFVNRELTAADLAGAVFAGYPFTAHHKDCWRTSSNFLLGQHVGLDFDAGDQTSRLDVLTKDKFISKYASFLYTTLSHTDEAPRSRVVFLLDTPIYQPKNYTLASSALLWLFGAADRQCKDCARFWYGSPNCGIDFLENVLPLSVVKHLIQQYQESGATTKRKTERKDWQAPATQSEVAEALKRIPAWQIDYDEWVQVLMGLHSEFGEDGLSLAESWADGYSGEVERKWRSFRADGNTSGAVTVATVFGIAKRFGWQKAA